MKTPWPNGRNVTALMEQHRCQRSISSAQFAGYVVNVLSYANARLHFVCVRDMAIGLNREALRAISTFVHRATR
jgi:hypothetical protein